MSHLFSAEISAEKFSSVDFLQKISLSKYEPFFSAERFFLVNFLQKTSLKTYEPSVFCWKILFSQFLQKISYENMSNLFSPAEIFFEKKWAIYFLLKCSLEKIWAIYFLQKFPVIINESFVFCRIISICFLQKKKQ